MSKTHACPVCSGLGGWSRETYRPAPRPVIDAAAREAWIRCMYCEGSGRNPRAVAAVA